MQPNAIATDGSSHRVRNIIGRVAGLASSVSIA